MHKRLAHLDIRQVRRMRDAGLVEGMEKVAGTGTRHTCDTCGASKSHRRAISKSSKNRKPATAPMERVHTDTLEVDVPALSGYKYAIVFLDEYTGYVWVGLMHRKTESLAKFKEFELACATQYGHRIKRLHMDNGSEYRNKAFASYCKSRQIKRRFSPSYTPEHNGRAERQATAGMALSDAAKRPRGVCTAASAAHAISYHMSLLRCLCAYVAVCAF